MNFYVAILILQMEESIQHFWCIMLYYYKKGNNATEMQKKISAVYEEGTVTDRICPKWFGNFCWHRCHFGQRILCCGLSYALQDV